MYLVLALGHTTTEEVTLHDRACRASRFPIPELAHHLQVRLQSRLIYCKC